VIQPRSRAQTLRQPYTLGYRRQTLMADRSLAIDKSNVGRQTKVVKTGCKHVNGASESMERFYTLVLSCSCHRLLTSVAVRMTITLHARHHSVSQIAVSPGQAQSRSRYLSRRAVSPIGLAERNVPRQLQMMEEAVSEVLLMISSRDHLANSLRLYAGRSRHERRHLTKSYRQILSPLSSERALMVI
jgi:hypothetical protein